MVQRHVVRGTIVYCILDELPPEAGGGFHALYYVPGIDRESRPFPSVREAQRWLRSKIDRHRCGAACHSTP